MTSSIESIGIQSTDCKLAASTPTSMAEELNKMIQLIAMQRMQIARLKEECCFVRDLHVCLLSSTNFATQSDYERLIKKYEPILTQDQRVDECARLVENIDEANIMHVLLQKLNKISIYAQVYDSGFMDKQKQELTKIGDLIKHSESLLDSHAAAINSIWTAENWKLIHETFEKKSLTFSHNFINRCQRVAQKAIAT